jgi:phosphoadenosine phosphosulfate reductase
MPTERPDPRPDAAAILADDLAGRDTPTLLHDLIDRVFPGRIALVTSFGAESVVLLHLAAGIDPNIPVIFLDTGKLFPETLAYRDRLIARLGLRDVRSIAPDAGTLAHADPEGSLWRTSADQCCWHRKVEPLDTALRGFAAWITGRKRVHGGGRATLPLIERAPDGRTKVNPLINWNHEALDRYMACHDLPRHPLLAMGFRSIGCAPCTRPVRAGEASRAGRWSGSGKTECGIHRADPTPPVAAGSCAGTSGHFRA